MGLPKTGVTNHNTQRCQLHQGNDSNSMIMMKEIRKKGIKVKQRPVLFWEGHLKLAVWGKHAFCKSR